MLKKLWLGLKNVIEWARGNKKDYIHEFDASNLTESMSKNLTE